MASEAGPTSSSSPHLLDDDEDDGLTAAAAPPPRSAEDRKAAAALSHISAGNADEDDDDDEPQSNGQHGPAHSGTDAAVDREALGRAMQNLDLNRSAMATTTTGHGQGKTQEAAAGAGSGTAAVTATTGKAGLFGAKLNAADVALLVDELELSKIKATELLRRCEGDIVRALKAFVAPEMV
ncbi:MAG: hypothetical protein M1826_000075 [Phylliscum demangeonii]|nr:MAG: hypothetical protein M1826_000075 [Phylliscum demangeonii]